METSLCDEGFLNFAFCSLIFEFVRLLPDNELPGDYTYGETPDPIPNSEAKPVRPMVVLMGESRSSPGFIKAGTERCRPFPLRPIQLVLDRCAFWS